MNKNYLLEQISDSSLINYTENISKEVRISGSDEEYRAFEYVKNQLDSMGFDTDLYKRKAYISFPVEAKLKIDGKIYEAITHSMAPSTECSGIEGKVVYVGEGNDLDYKENIEGKIVLIDGLAIPYTVANAEKNGAIAAIFINAEYTHEMIVSTVWGNPTNTSSEEYPKIPIVSVNFSDGNEIKEMLTKKYLISSIQTVVQTEWRDIPTLIAEYKGKDNPNDYVLFSGHVDSWHYGAMDNGAANATMLEIARIITENKISLYRSLRLAFWSGHSHGRYAGSALYVDENWEDLYDHCVLHVNIDSVGGKYSTILSEGNSMKETLNIASQSIEEIAGQKFNGTRYGRSGDQSFWGPGVPSLLMGLSEQEKTNTPETKAFSKLFGGGKAGGFGWWWHTTEDTIDKINPEYLLRDCRIYFSIIYHVCTSPKLPINQVEAIKEIQSYISKYADEVPHLKIFHTLKNRTLKLLDNILKVEESGIHISEGDENKLNKYNSWNKKISKGLIRINYVNETPFGHDPAFYTPPVPLLSDALYYQNVESLHEKLVLENRLVRKANEVNFILKSLNTYTEEYLYDIGL